MSRRCGDAPRKPKPSYTGLYQLVEIGASDPSEPVLAGRLAELNAIRDQAHADSVPMVRWAVSAVPGGLADYPDVKRHHEHMLADPAVQRAMRDEGLIKD